MKKLNLFSNLWSLLVGSQKDDGSTRLRVVFDSFTCRLRVLPSRGLRMAAMLCMLLTLSIGNAWGTNTTTTSNPAPAGTYTAMVSGEAVVAGDTIIIVCETSGKAMSTTQNSNNRGSVSVTISNSSPKTVTLNGTTTAQALSVAASANSGWTLYTGVGYLYAPNYNSGTGNYLRTDDTGKDGSGGNWTIAYNSVVAAGSGTRRYIQRNGDLISCYSSGSQTAIQVYKKAHAVTYKANGGSTTCSDATLYKSNATVTVCSTTPTRSGYTFTGWSANVNLINASTSATITAGTPIAGGTTVKMPSAEIILTAQWEADAPAYTITAQSNNNSYGTVSLDGSVITASPTSGYRVSTSTPYTVSPANSATVSQNGNEFTVTPSANTTITINFEAIPTHDIHFNTGGLVVIADAEDIQEGDTYDITETPAASLSGDCEYSTFVGWTTASSIADASICPSTVTSVTMSTSDVTLYAVYSKTTGSGFKLSLNSGGTEYYIGAKGSGAYMSAVTDAADAVVFTFATGYLSFDDSGTKTYISSAGDNTTLTVGTSVPSSTWTESGTTTFTYQSSAAGTRYLGFNSGANPVRFAPYGSTYAHEFTKHNAGTTTYSLSANCNAPRITVSLTEIDFGDVKVGTSPTATFTVSGTNLSEDIGLAISGPQAGRYSVSESSLTPNAGGTVAETTITVTFSPTASADHRAQVNITSEGATTKTVSLKAYSKWEVTWMKNGGNFTTTLVAGGQKPTFPDPAPTSCDASSTAFRGWTQTPWSGKQSQTYVDGLTDDDTKVHVDNTTMTTVSSNDVVYHAVFAKATGSDETDVINYSATSSQLSGESESAYVDNFTITGSTGAQYRIHSMGTSSGIALRWNTNGFLYCSSAPTSGAKLSSVTITTTADKSIGVYASNSAYSGDTKPSATSLGTVVATSSGATKNITDSYAYIGLTGTASSTVISSITITYGGTTYSDYMTTCCETPTLAFVSSPYATVRQDIGGASTSTWAEVDVTFTSNSTGTITAGTPYQLAANKWQVYETTGGSACVATHATFEVLTQPSGETPGTGKFSVKTTSAGTQTGQGTYRIALTQAATDESHGNYCETTVYGFVDVTLRDKFVDNVNGNGTVNKDGHGAQLATPALSEFGTQVENACHSEGRKLKGWIKETDLKTQYENGNSTRVQTIDGLCESCDDGTDQKSLIVAPGTNVTMSGATWYAVWAYER